MSLHIPRRGVSLGACAIVLFFVVSLVASGRQPSTVADAAASPTGLVAAFGFDETAGTTAADASGTANTGTVTGATWTTAGHSGGALSFDGASDYVTVADNPSLDLGTGMTAEAWVYPTAAPAYAAVIAKERAGGGFPYGLESTAGVADGFVNAGGSANAAATNALAPNAWTHLATTYDGTTLRLYVNGALASSQAVSGALVNSADPLRIGGDVTWGEWFQGKLDDIRVYNRALSASEVTTDMNTAVKTTPPPPPSGVVASYGFENGSGATASDSSGNGRSGSVSGATWTTAGKFGNALSFDGASDSVTVADAPALDLTNALTLEAWVFPTSNSGYSAVIAKERAGGGFPYGMESAAGLPDAYASNGTPGIAAATSTLPVNAWTHLASTYDGTTLRLYVNGALAGSQALAAPLATSTDPLRIGGDVTWGEWFQGKIDEVRIYNKALSATAIQTDMNTAVAGGSPPPPPPTDTQAPTTPGGLTVGTKTQTSVALSWSASTDNVGVTGYGVYNGSSRVQQVASTGATVTGLACGTTYTLGADAYDAAGNRSAKSTIAAATAACPAPTGGSVFLSTSGSDSNPCTQSAPCRSFDRGYQVAQPGQVVEVAGGSYGDQDILFDSSHTSSSDVVIQPAAGASVTIGMLDIGSTRMEAGASHLTVKNITVTGDVAIPGCGVPDNTACPPDAQSPGNDLTFQNLRVKGPYAFYCASCSNVSLIGGTWGPDTYTCRSGFGSAHPEVQSAYTQVKRAHGILIDGVDWQNFARCSGSDHTECLQVEPADDMTVRNSTFRNCDTIVVNFANDLANANSAAGYRAPNNILIENNFFDTAKDATGGPTYYALNIRECTNCTVRYNSWTQAPRMPTGEVSINNKFIGNAGPMPSSNCGINGVTYSHNVWEGASCSSTDKNVSNVGFVNRGTVDLHLAAGSAAINAGDPSVYPAADIDGNPRPLGGVPDAGASERQ